MEFVKPKIPNWQVKIGDNPEDQTIVFNLYLEKPLNRFQRWMCKKCLGMHWRKLDETEG